MKTRYPGISDLAALFRLTLSLAIAFSGCAGAILFSRSLNAFALYVFSGIFLLSCAASAFNQILERQWDLLMERTSDRPLPSKRIRPCGALVLAVVTGIAGVMVLGCGGSRSGAFLGVLNLLLYVAVYTPLKRRSRYAYFIGALTGAIPPMIGWTAAGGPAGDPFILVVALFMYVWQIPHFLLLQLRFGKEYAAAGFPPLLAATGEKKVRRIVFLWLLSSSASSLLFPLFHCHSGFHPISIILVLNGMVILLFHKMLFRKTTPLNFTVAFRSLYLYQAGMLVILMGNVFLRQV